jgi:hypothetical protein
MDRARATQIARVVEHLGQDLRVKDPALQRAGRLARVQAAWLRSLADDTRTTRSARGGDRAHP